MSNALKVGDRVKIVPNAKDEILIPYQMPDALAERIEELTAVITEVHKCRIATVRFDTGAYYMDFSNLQRIPDNPRRTFEEIGNELSASLGAEWGKVQFFDNRMELRSVNNTDLVIFDNGGVVFEVDACMNSEIRLCLFQLAAISAACQEIAANYAAAHGKEEAR